MIITRRRRQFRPSVDALGVRILPSVFTAPPEEYPTTPTQDAGNYPGSPTYNPTIITPPSSSTTPSGSGSGSSNPMLITPPSP